MQLCNTALALLVLTASTVADAADDATTFDETQASFDAERKSSNSANDPTEPRLTLEYWNYYAPSLNNLNGGAENGEGRILIPYQINGIQQLFHIDPPIVTNPTAKTGPRTGLGDAQIYNLTLFKRDIGLYEHEPITFGIGPLIAAPTNTSTNFGTNSLQAGAAGAIIAPQRWGLLGVLATYQRTVSGASTQLTTAQPNVFYNLHDGWYLRSSAVMRFDTSTHTITIPIGLGAGKVIHLAGGYTLNLYAEAQPSVYRSGTARQISSSSPASNYNSRRASPAAGIFERADRQLPDLYVVADRYRCFFTMSDR